MDRSNNFVLKLNSRDSTGQLDCAQLRLPAASRALAADEDKKRLELLDICADGLMGSFRPIRNDFSTSQPSDGRGDTFEGVPIRGELAESPQAERAGRFRFLIASMGLVALTLSLATRTAFNLSLVEMTRGEQVPTTDDPPFEATTTATGAYESEEADTSLRFDWTRGQRNFLLASFYIGYAPCMLISGGLADRYGSKALLFTCILGSSLINLFTPLMAASSYLALASSRMALGVLSGGLVPATYDLFKRWLTATETSIFAPLIKMSFAGGASLGSMLPWLVKRSGHQWPMVFYAGSLLCALWALPWLLLASNSPQTSRFVGLQELERVMRKKRPPMTISIVLQDADGRERSKSVVKVEGEGGKKREEEAPDRVPWLAIVSHPSVLVLALTKYTYNLGMEFVPLAMPAYLAEVHRAPIETIGAISTACTLLQLLLVSPVAWLAKVAVQRRLWGLSKTKWRKLFQGTANLAIGCLFLLCTLAHESLSLFTAFMVLVCLFWMLGAGGESLLPYDLSARYPATIMGFTHSISITAGLTLPAYSSLLLGNDLARPNQQVGWSHLFLLLGSLLILGGLLFVLVVKAKPFLPGERAK